MDRLDATIRHTFHHPNLCQVVRDHISSCPVCLLVQTTHQPYGHLAPRNAPIIPCSEVNINSIGPWTISVNQHRLEFNALTCIDPVTNLLEIIRYPTAKTATEAARLFENHWLARYPRPCHCVSDHGPEFNGHDFQFLLQYAGIEAVNISPHTPNANAVIEVTHKAIGQSIRTTVHTKPPSTPRAAEHLVNEALAIAMHACCCAANSTLGNYSSGALVFQCDMFLDIPLITDILTLTQHCQALINCRLLHANTRRINHEYHVGDLVYVRNTRDQKLQLPFSGPFPILQVHTNNTVTIQRGPIHECINIRHLKPSKSKP